MLVEALYIQMMVIYFMTHKMMETIKSKSHPKITEMDQLICLEDSRTKNSVVCNSKPRP